jgi:hypothetical protein
MDQKTANHSATQLRKEASMQGSDLIFIVLPVVIPLVLAIGVALPFIADSRAGRSQSARDAVWQPVETRAGSAPFRTAAARADTANPPGRAA